MNSIVVYTAIFGNRDRLKDPVAHAGVDYVCFTDDPTVASNVWKILCVPKTSESPRSQAKEYKVLPHKFFPDHAYSIWVDGTHSLVTNPHDLVDSFLGEKPLAVFRHHKRRCIYDEARECIILNLDARATIERQVEMYRKERYPEKAGLSTCTVIFRKHNDARVVEAMERWWLEIRTHSIRDQISFDYVMHATKLPFLRIDGNVYANDHFARGYHEGTKELLLSEHPAIMSLVSRAGYLKTIWAFNLKETLKRTPRPKKRRPRWLLRLHKRLGVIGKRMAATMPGLHRTLGFLIRKIPMLSIEYGQRLEREHMREKPIKKNGL